MYILRVRLIVITLCWHTCQVREKGSAASVAARVKLALIVGICGGVLLRRDGEEMLLGDDVISTRIVILPYDFGRQCQE